MTAPRTSVVARDELTTSFIAFIAAGTGKPCGDHEAPPGATLVDGYTIVYTIEGGEYSGPPLWAPEADAEFVYQVTSVGKKRDQAEWIADRVRLTVTSRTPAGGFQVAFPVLAGAKVIQRRPDGTPPGVIPEGVSPNRVFSVPERFRLAVVST